MTANPVDFRQVQRDVTGRLRWLPVDFWGSTAHECDLALSGLAAATAEETERLAWLTANLVNGAREVQGKRFRAKRTTDYFRPAAESPTERDVATLRASLRESPRTLAPEHFRRPAPS